MTQYRMENLMDELKALPTMPGLAMADLLEIPETTRQFLQWILRRKEVDLKEIADTLEQSEDSTLALLNGLIQCGMVERVGQVESQSYRLRMRIQTSSLRRTPREDLWKALDETAPSTDPKSPEA